MHKAFRFPNYRFALLIGALLTASSPALAISGGERVDEERFAAEYPWAVVAVNKLGGGICNGTLIAPEWVLTAAHCSGGERYVLAGHPLRSLATRVEIAKRIVHPLYDNDSGEYDVALLQLDVALDIPPAPLASRVQSDLMLISNTSGVVLGWGRSEFSRKPVDRLREAEALLNNLFRTQSTYAYQGSVGPCPRDSGSPMLMRTLDGRRMVIGVARAAQGMCTSDEGAAVYTNVGRVESFIKKHVPNIGKPQ